mmetsp:Transcript_11751/g.24196  ORF Transcript_11751/g.24196 Transcript_11751/m.24196 type:complete len:336 (+) Transcript_11751:127-1134(+)
MKSASKLIFCLAIPSIVAASGAGGSGSIPARNDMNAVDDGPDGPARAVNGVQMRREEQELPEWLTLEHISNILKEGPGDQPSLRGSDWSDYADGDGGVGEEDVVPTEEDAGDIDPDYATEQDTMMESSGPGDDAAAMKEGGGEDGMPCTSETECESSYCNANGICQTLHNAPDPPESSSGTDNTGPEDEDGGGDGQMMSGEADKEIDDPDHTTEKDTIMDGSGPATTSSTTTGATGGEDGMPCTREDECESLYCNANGICQSLHNGSDPSEEEDPFFEEEYHENIGGSCGTSCKVGAYVGSMGGIIACAGVYYYVFVKKKKRKMLEKDDETEDSD